MSNRGDGIHASGHGSADPADTPEMDRMLNVSLLKPTMKKGYKINCTVMQFVAAAHL